MKSALLTTNRGDDNDMELFPDGPNSSSCVCEMVDTLNINSNVIQRGRTLEVERRRLPVLEYTCYFY